MGILTFLLGLVLICFFINLWTKLCNTLPYAESIDVITNSSSIQLMGRTSGCNDWVLLGAWSYNELLNNPDLPPFIAKLINAGFKYGPNKVKQMINEWNALKSDI